MIRIGIIGTRTIVQRFIKQAATNKKSYNNLYLFKKFR